MATDIKTEPQVREGERIAKVIARAGLCSRRDAEEWVAAGRVSVNGEVLTSPAYNVSPFDAVMVDGKPLDERQRTRLFMYHKPKGLITSSKDPEGRPTVFDSLPPGLPRVVSIGRLDINTEGLLLLTNDGGLARVLELPETGWLRRYRVRAHGEVNQSQLDALKDGVSVEGVNYAGIEARLERTVGSNLWLTMGLREGKNREIKRVLEHLGLQVNRLIRISFGPFELAELPEGEVDEIPTRVLRDQLGVKLAKRANADFDSPVYDAPPPAPDPIVAPPPRREARPERRAKDAETPKAPRREGGNTEPRKRKHISILRAEARAETEAERKRVVRTATSDRKGRAVKVERISVARPAREEKPTGRKGGAPRARSSGDGAAREPAPRPRSYANASARDGAAKFRKPRDETPRDGAPRPAAPRTRSFGDSAARGGASKSRSHGDASKRDAPPRARPHGDGPAKEGARTYRKPREESGRDGAPRSASPRTRPPGDGAAKFREPREQASGKGAPRPRARPPGEGAPRGGGFKRDGGKGRPPGKGKPGGGGDGKRPPRRPA